MGWFSELRDAERSADTPSFLGTTTDVDWSCWPAKSEGAGPMRLALSSGLWRDSEHAQNRHCCANWWSKRGDSGGGPCSPVRPPERLPALW